MIMAKRIYESPSNTEKAKSLRCDKKGDDEINSKSIGFLKLMPISQLDPNKLNSNKEVLQRFFKIQSKYLSCVSKKKVADELLLEIFVNCGKIPCPKKFKTTCIKNILKFKKDFKCTYCGKA